MTSLRRESMQRQEDKVPAKAATLDGEKGLVT
jgi:hypothetical protein